jgi:hypothetical protein
LHPLPKYLLDGALLNKTAPFLGDYLLRWTLACRFSFPLARRDGMPEGALIEEALILWLSYFASITAIFVLGGGAAHLLLIIKIAKLIILFGLLWIGLYLAYVLLGTNWL